MKKNCGLRIVDCEFVIEERREKSEKRGEKREERKTWAVGGER